jgi:8-oxo-dGTP diphosphatase
MEQEYFIIPQRALIMDGEKILVLKRSPDESTYPGCWDLPGGRLENGENPSHGLKREVLEETGLKINVLKPLFTFHEILNNIPTFFVVYQCEAVSGAVQLSAEHTEFKWATESEILEHENLENYLKVFLAKNQPTESLK